MMAFVLDCHPEVSQIRQLNPGLSTVRHLPDIKYFSLSDSMKQVNHDARSSSRGAAADSKAVPAGRQQTRALSLEEIRREAREDWRRNYYDKRADQLGRQPDSSRADEHAEEDKTRPKRGAGLDFDPER
ncbi:MAG TPA: hypothetical protein VN692_12455 [Steroidobacteraceae bacterium]|nr:hypothetical protein [Steroidobacteraceae bacterium]